MFVVNVSFFKVDDIIVNEHVDLEIVNQMNFATNHNLDDFVIFLIKKIHRCNDVLESLMLINDNLSYRKRCNHSTYKEIRILTKKKSTIRNNDF